MVFMAGIIIKQQIASMKDFQPFQFGKRGIDFSPRWIQSRTTGSIDHLPVTDLMQVITEQVIVFMTACDRLIMIAQIKNPHLPSNCLGMKKSSHIGTLLTDRITSIKQQHRDKSYSPAIFHHLGFPTSIHLTAADHQTLHIPIAPQTL